MTVNQRFWPDFSIITQTQYIYVSQPVAHCSKWERTSVKGDMNRIKVTNCFICNVGTSVNRYVAALGWQSEISIWPPTLGVWRDSELPCCHLYWLWDRWGKCWQKKNEQSLPVHNAWMSLQKHALMDQIAHQAIVMQFILDLARTLSIDPRGCFRQFFSKIKVCLNSLLSQTQVKSLFCGACCSVLIPF